MVGVKAPTALMWAPGRSSRPPDRGLAGGQRADDIGPLHRFLHAGGRGDGNAVLRAHLRAVALGGLGILVINRHRADVPHGGHGGQMGAALGPRADDRQAMGVRPGSRSVATPDHSSSTYLGDHPRASAHAQKGAVFRLKQHHVADVGGIGGAGVLRESREHLGAEAVPKPGGHEAKLFSAGQQGDGAYRLSKAALLQLLQSGAHQLDAHRHSQPLADLGGFHDFHSDHSPLPVRWIKSVPAR